MCWSYSECATCGDRTYCTSECMCSDEEIDEGRCPHRDCKSFERCELCGNDLCDGCYEMAECESCWRIHCAECTCPRPKCDSKWLAMFFILALGCQPNILKSLSAQLLCA